MGIRCVEGSLFEYNARFSGYFHDFAYGLYVFILSLDDGFPLGGDMFGK
jgi:hypothetical protein